MDLSPTQERLLLASLPHVAFDGWGQRALRAAAQDLEIAPELAFNAFPRGAADLLEAFSAWADRATLVELEHQDLAAMKVRDRIALGVRTRLMTVEPHREAVRRAVAALAMPQHAALGLACAARTVDALWYAAGDRATDYNYYTKRLLLAGVYSSTLLVWLNDSSEDYTQSWAFLERRIDNVLKVGGRLGKGLKGLLDLPDRLARRLNPGAAGR
ncbi:MAG: COQ9 family protein [Pseudomonadota bacterium]